LDSEQMLTGVTLEKCCLDKPNMWIPC